MSDSSMLSNAKDSTTVRFVPTIPELHYELWSSSCCDERIFRFDTSGSSRRVMDWNDAAETKIQASIHKAIKVILHANKRIDNQELIENVGAAYNPLDKIAYELGTSDDSNGSYDREDFLNEVGKHYRAGNKNDSLTIYVYLELSDLTDAIRALYEYPEHTPASGSMKSSKSLGSMKSGKGSVLSRGAQSNRANVSPAGMVITAGSHSGSQRNSPPVVSPGSSSGAVANNQPRDDTYVSDAPTSIFQPTPPAPNFNSPDQSDSTIHSAPPALNFLHPAPSSFAARGTLRLPRPPSKALSFLNPTTPVAGKVSTPAPGVAPDPLVVNQGSTSAPAQLPPGTALFRIVVWSNHQPPLLVLDLMGPLSMVVLAAIPVVHFEAIKSALLLSQSILDVP